MFRHVYVLIYVSKWLVAYSLHIWLHSVPLSSNRRGSAIIMWSYWTFYTVTYCQALKLGEQLFEFPRNFLKKNTNLKKTGKWGDCKIMKYKTNFNSTMEEHVCRHWLWDLPPYLPRLSQSADGWSVQTHYNGKEWVQVPLRFTTRSEKQMWKCVKHKKYSYIRPIR